MPHTCTSATRRSPCARLALWDDEDAASSYGGGLNRWAWPHVALTCVLRLRLRLIDVYLGSYVTCTLQSIVQCLFLVVVCSPITSCFVLYMNLYPMSSIPFRISQWTLVSRLTGYYTTCMHLPTSRSDSCSHIVSTIGEPLPAQLYPQRLWSGTRLPITGPTRSGLASAAYWVRGQCIWQRSHFSRPRAEEPTFGHI